MSSILDALKKLEREKADVEREAVLAPTLTLGGRLPLEDRMKKNNGRQLAIGVGGALFFIVSVVYLLSGPSGKGTDAISRTAPVTEKTAEIPGDPAMKTETMEDAVAFDETVQRPPATEKAPDDSEETLAADTEVLDKEAQASIDELASLVKKKSSILDGNRPSSGPEDSQFDRKARALVKKIPKNILPPQRTVDSSWLSLHAISWSSNPINRIAVINSMVVKEGRRVEGGLVKRIEKDHVIIEKDGEDLMLPFNNH